MKTKNLYTRGLTLALMAALATPAASRAATICVDPAGNGCQTSIQLGIDAASAGDTVNIKAATYAETVTIPTGKNGLTLNGSGAIIDGTTTAIDTDALLVLSSGVTINGLKIQNTQRDGIVIGDDIEIPTGTTITAVTIAGVAEDCIHLNGADNTSISGAYLLACGDLGIEAQTGPDSNGSDNFSVTSTRIFSGDNGCIRIQGDNANVTGTTLTQCEDEQAIYVEGDAPVVIGNKITGTDSQAIYLQGDNAIVDKNKIAFTYDYAIFVAGNNASVTKNKASFSGAIAVSADPCDGGLIAGNKVSDTQQNLIGIEATCYNGTGGMVVSKNKVTRATHDCFAITGDLLSVTGNKASVCGASLESDGFYIYANGSTISGNSAARASDSGFEVSGNNNVLSENKSKGNYGAGFALEVDSTGNQLTDNSASGNLIAGYAVFGSSTTLTLTGNSSSGDFVPLCQDELTSVVTDGMGNSFSLAMPPFCNAYNR